MMTSLLKLLSGSGVRRVGMVSAVAGLCLSVAAEAQTADSRARVFEMVRSRLAIHQSDYCNSYIGKTVTVSPFSTVAQNLFTPPTQGEFETAEQYAARLRAVAARAPTSPIVIALPTDRDFITYAPGSGTGLMIIKAGAFGVVEYLDDAQLDVSETLALSQASLSNGTRVLQNVSDHPIRNYVARNGLGLSVNVSEIERKANFVYLAERLFPHAASGQIAVLSVDVPLAQAPALKQTLRVALAVVPKAPYVFKYEDEGAVPTMQNPVQYKYKLTNLYADAKCGLVLNSQSRVLAAANAGS